MSERFRIGPLAGANFGGEAMLASPPAGDATMAIIEAAEAEPEALPAALDRCHGLLVLRGMTGISQDPGLIVRLSRLFGAEVENYHHTLTARNRVHETVPEILLVTNLPPGGREPPARPVPPLTDDGKLPLQFPQRIGWHTDQSYRRPPPDISLFYAVIPGTKGEGQTLFASGVLGYAALSDAMKARIAGMDGIHVMPGTNRSEDAVREGRPPRPLGPHEQPQRQPLVRVHPVTGTKALYLCERGQMDWLSGPIADMEPGPGGAGAALLYELMIHMTKPEFCYAHDWDEGDLVIWDNRSLAHSATWFDTSKSDRLMWRTTIHGNPGPEYAGERKSWAREMAAD
ncbi:MAG: TauD/TfdA dioxygenase family protein [Alphaproteobacteria bacterium]